MEICDEFKPYQTRSIVSLSPSPSNISKLLIQKRNFFTQSKKKKNLSFVICCDVKTFLL